MNPSRRRFIKYAALAAAGTAVGAYFGYPYLFTSKQNGGQISSATSTSTTSYIPGNVSPDYAQFLQWLNSVSKPYAGQTINMALQLEPTPLAMQQLAPDFFKATSINDQYDIKPYFLHLSDLSFMVGSGAPTYDAFDVDHQDTGFFKNHIISPSELSDKYPDLTYAKINPNDFQKTAWSLFANYPPSSYAGPSSSSTKDIFFIPFDMDVMIEYYRTDLFSSMLISPPMTWDEYFQDVKVLNKSQTRFGTVTQGGPSISVIYEFLNHLSSFGGKLWNYDGTQLTSALDTQEALSALENYVRLSPYSDPSSPYYSWDDVTRDLLLGVAGTALQFNSFQYFMNDPIRSKVVGLIGYNQSPAGPAGSFSTFGGSGLGVSRYSRHPEAAWLWLQWATSLGAQEAALLNSFHAYPSRLAAFEDSVVKSALQKSGYEALRVARRVWDANRVATLVAFPKWTQVLDVLSLHLSKAVAGSETPQIALSAAVRQIGSKGRLTF